MVNGRINIFSLAKTASVFGGVQQRKVYFEITVPTAMFSPLSINDALNIPEYMEKYSSGLISLWKRTEVHCQPNENMKSKSWSPIQVHTSGEVVIAN